MKKYIAGLAVLAFALTASSTTSVLAQKKFTPRGIWQGMLGNVSDVQAMVTALAVFDMKRLAEIADNAAKKQAFWAKHPRIPEADKKYYAELSDAFKKVGDAARAGDDQLVAEGIGGVLKVCSACHYDIRDAPRRK